MTVQDLKRHASKVRMGLAGLAQKAKVEPEYRRLCILAVALVIATAILSPSLGIALALVGAWYLTY